MKRTVTVAFHLSMPGRASWSGGWSGEGRPYVLVRTLSRVAAEPILAAGSFGYAFGDGWCASVRAREVDATEARKLRRTSAGFCGYDWMVDSILYNGKIVA